MASSVVVALCGLGRAAQWFLAGWMCSGGFARIADAIFRRRAVRDYLRGEGRILAAPFRVLETIEETKAE